MKVLDSASLRDTMKEREQHYKELGTQFSQLKQDFQTIVDLDDFEGKGAKAIKGFYQGQIEVVEAWQRLIDRQISFFEGVSGKLDDKDLGGDTRVDTAFLEEDLAQKERQADEMITEQRNSLEYIFRDIDDLVPLELYSRSRFDDLMMNANSMRTKTITAVEETDNELKDEYMSSEGEESYVIQLFGALLSATSKGKSISPIHFDADAYHTSDIYKQMDEAEAATLSYLTYKKEEQEARELENRPAVEKVWDGVKSFVGEFTGYYDYKRAVDGVDPVTGEKMSAIQRAASAGWAIAGFLPIVGWAGRAVKGGKGIYAATKGISAAEQAMSTYKNVHAFTALEKTEMGIYGLLSANGLSEYVTGKDMLGNELTEQQRQASLAQSVFAGLPFVPSMAREATKFGQDALNTTISVGKQGKDLTYSWLNDLGGKIDSLPQLRTTNGVDIDNNYLQLDNKINGKPTNNINDDIQGMSNNDKNIKSKLQFNNIGEYFNYINDIGKRKELDTEQKLQAIHVAYEALGNAKGDVTVVASSKYLRPEGFGPSGRMLVDWPEKMGFIEETIRPIERENPLPEQWDRIGGKAGENFTTLPSSGIPYSYDQRAIPYFENETARHIGNFKNDSYFKAIDAINSDNLDELNKIISRNGKEVISVFDFDRMKAHYNNFLENAKDTIGDIDAKYGIKGYAAPWYNTSSGERLMNGGAEQIVTPINGEMLEMIGIISKY
ncbi:ribonuclease YeeF family protein [Niallia taxi]|uniref:ribonuclease YeeF family protein n=1 Tax=Niallia taxi TaxID=2499688 RepID=UPI003D28221C